jgi:hypothetical protein
MIEKRENPQAVDYQQIADFLMVRVTGLEPAAS